MPTAVYLETSLKSRSLVRRIMETHCGYTVTSFIDECISFSQFLTIKPDILVIDLPSDTEDKLNNLLHAVTQNPKTNTIPILFLTTSLDFIPQIDGLENYFIHSRPLDIYEFRQQLKDLDPAS